MLLIKDERQAVNPVQVYICICITMQQGEGGRFTGMFCAHIHPIIMIIIIFIIFSNEKKLPINKLEDILGKFLKYV